MRPLAIVYCVHGCSLHTSKEQVMLASFPDFIGGLGMRLLLSINRRWYQFACSRRWWRVNMFMTTPTRSPLEQVFCLFRSHMGDGGEHMGTVHCCTLYAVAMVDHPISSFLEVATTCSYTTLHYFDHQRIQNWLVHVCRRETIKGPCFNGNWSCGLRQLG